jgi:hypothetical protein
VATVLSTLSYTKMCLGGGVDLEGVCVCNSFCYGVNKLSIYLSIKMHENDKDLKNVAYCLIASVSAF